MTGAHRKPRATAWAALGVLAVALAGAILFEQFRPGRAEAEPAATVQAARHDVSSVVRATGVVKPKVGAEVRVGSRVSGIVNRLHVKIGDVVRAGEPLAELDSTEWQARRDQATATLETARTNQRYAEIEERRKRGLFEEGLITAADRDSVEQAVVVARQRVQEAEAALRAIAIQADYTRITAPISGVVATVTTQEGETVSAGLVAPTFVTILDLDRLEVRAYVDETDIGRIQLGQRCTFTVDTYPGVEFDGRVTAIYPKAEIQDNVVNYLVIIEIGDRQGRAIRPEMTTSVTIAVETRRAVLTVPRGAVFTEQGRRCVYVPRGEQRELRAVTTGWKDERDIEILDGLREGESVFVEPRPAPAASGLRTGGPR